MEIKMKKNKQIRIERIKERGPNNRNLQEQLDHLDSKGFTATKERAKLLKKIVVLKNGQIEDKKNANKDKKKRGETPHPQRKQKIQKKDGKTKRGRKG